MNMESTNMSFNENQSNSNSSNNIEIAINKTDVEPIDSTAEPIKNEVLVASSCLLLFQKQIKNLLFYHRLRKIGEVPNENFFEINNHIFQYIANHLKEMDQFINSYIKKKKIESNMILSLWKDFKKFLLNYFYSKDTLKNKIEQVPIIENDFKTFLLCLVNEEIGNQNGIQIYLQTNLVYPNKQFRKEVEFARALIILILDAPAYVIHLDEENPVVEMKIYFLEIKFLVYDNDIIYSFSHLDVESTSSSLISSINNPVESLVTDDSSKLNKIRNYQLKIRPRFDLNKKPNFWFLRMANLKKPSYFIIIFKTILSLLSVLDIFLDLSLACKYLQSGKILYGLITISLLIVVGIINIFFEKQILESPKFDSSYLPHGFDKAYFRYMSSFLQLSPFLSTLKSTILSIKARKENQLLTVLKIIFQTNSGNLQQQSKMVKYVETYLEAAPQILLQIYIILETKEWSWLQLLPIINGVVNINVSVLSFAAMLRMINIPQLWRHPVLVLKIICYNGLLLTSHILLFWQYHWIIPLSWIALHFFISYFSKRDKEDGALIFFNSKYKLKYEIVFNVITVMENIILVTLFFFKENGLKNPVFVGLFTSHILFSVLWSLIIAKDKFDFDLNIMHMPFFIRDSFL